MRLEAATAGLSQEISAGYDYLQLPPIFKSEFEWHAQDWPKSSRRGAKYVV